MRWAAARSVAIIKSFSGSLVMATPGATRKPSEPRPHKSGRHLLRDLIGHTLAVIAETESVIRKLDGMDHPVIDRKTSN
jgi:hypothetical protein